MADEPLYVQDRDFARRSGAVWSQPHYGTASYKDYARVIHSPSWRRLQGKMQLFPVGQNDVLRTRLTHSLEVAEISVRIANWLNGRLGHPYFQQGGPYAIDRDVISTAALSHDLGHPPFGHAGEEALNAALGSRGIFEGNAQTLRILTTLENRFDTARVRKIGESGDVGLNHVYGLDLTYRTLASVIKYDRNANSDFGTKYKQAHDPEKSKIERAIFKGYYEEEANLVRDIKNRLLGSNDIRLSTIECQIMDLADDIAYSTYDLEDAMVAGVVTPFDVIACKDEYLGEIALQVEKKLQTRGYKGRIDAKDVLAILMQVFSNILRYADQEDYKDNTIVQRITFVARSYRENLMHAESQPIRRRFMETLIEGAVRSVSVELNEKCPMLSRVNIDLGKMLEIECLKAFTFHTVTSSQANEISAHRGKKIVSTIWRELSNDNAGALLPDDLRPLLRNMTRDKADIMVRDLIATLTDDEAIELYRKLTAY